MKSPEKSSFEKMKSIIIFLLIFCLNHNSVHSQDTVALIIGSQVATTITNSVELFGCPNAASFEVEEFPFYNFLTGGVYLPGPERALVCGGYSCPENSQIGCEISSRCYFYSARYHVWAETGSMPAGRLAQFMFMATDMDNPEYGELPVILGPDATQPSLIYDPVTYLWKEYKTVTGESVAFYMTLGCVVQYGDEIIKIGEGKVISLDINTFVANKTADIPQAIGTRADTRCALGNVNGKDGILTQYGYWFDLEDKTWSYQTVTPLPFLRQEANAMFTFRGKPTIFGNAKCGTDGACPYKGVVQYDAETDKWIDLGDMLIERQMHSIVEVPSTFCDYFAPLPTVPPKPILPTPAPPSPTANAALVVAGFWPNHPTDPYLRTAELFGCPGRDSIPVKDYPLGSYLHAGVYIASSNRVLVCGGYSCDGGECTVRKNCYHFSPDWNVWSEMQEFSSPRWGHIMPLLNDLNVTQPQQTPVAMGLERDTEIYDGNLHDWRGYIDLPETSWYSTGCFLQHENGLIYDLRIDAVEFDPNTWQTRNLGQLPISVARVGRCGSIIKDDGEEGLLSKYGFYYRIADHTVLPMTTPPYPRHVQEPNCMATWRNKPTLFGVPRCNGEGVCVPTAVWQFDPNAEQWVDMGDLTEPRIMHSVVEVPVEFCDHF